MKMNDKWLNITGKFLIGVAICIVGGRILNPILGRTQEPLNWEIISAVAFSAVLVTFFYKAGKL
jgi:hypothetical protein